MVGKELPFIRAPKNPKEHVNEKNAQDRLNSLEELTSPTGTSRVVGLLLLASSFLSWQCCVAAVAEWYKYRTVACLVTSSSPIPLKTRRVGQRCTLNLLRAETSSRWCSEGCTDVLGFLWLELVLFVVSSSNWLVGTPPLLLFLIASCSRCSAQEPGGGPTSGPRLAVVPLPLRSILKLITFSSYSGFTG
ncbi:hypothetical protein TNCV_3264971 [Trichonephila clavipes]|nr:hypothetical protein TNCV_3264971 [Trichonephila clavipes]